MRVANARTGRVLGETVRVGDSFWARLRGLLGHPPLEAGEGLLIRPCTSVHMIGMRYPLDVAFLDAGGAVLACYPGLAPGRFSRWHRAATQAIELPGGTLAATGTEVGDTLEITPVAPSPRRFAPPLSQEGRGETKGMAPHFCAPPLPPWERGSGGEGRLPAPHSV